MEPVDGVDEGELAEPLTAMERKLRQRFVTEYVVDFDELSAVIRMGYQAAFAAQYAKQFMGEAYVLRQIAKEQERLGLTKEEDVHRKRVVAGLYRVATSRYANPSAQVAAYAQIAKVTGIEAPVKTQAVAPKVGDIDYSKLSTEELEVMDRLLQKAHASTT